MQHEGDEPGRGWDDGGAGVKGVEGKVPLEWVWPGQWPEAGGQTEEGRRINPLPEHLGLGGAALSLAGSLARGAGVE